jgi:ribosomal-protein-serine acetyltransferase
MTWCRPDYSMEDSRAFILKSAQDWDCDLAYSFAVLDERDGAFLGSVGLSQVNRSHRFANLGYWVRASRVGSGIATKITRLAANFALQKLGLNRVEILVPNGNIASQRVAQKAGAKFEGILRHRLILHNQTTDAVLYSIVAEDLPPAM